MLSTKKKAPIESGISGENYSITKFLNSLKDSMFVCKFGLSKMAISNSLLEYLGINVEEFAVQTIKYRTVLFEYLWIDIVFCRVRVTRIFLFIAWVT